MGLRAAPIAPGVVDIDTSTVSEGRWIDANRVRFWRGRAQSIGGWTPRTGPLAGVPRAAMALMDNQRRRIVVLGTHTNLWGDREGVVGDITPVGLPVGNASAGVDIGGYGTGTYGTGTYGGPGAGTGFLRTWSIYRWAQGAVAVPRQGPLCLWGGDPAVRATTVPAAPDLSDSMMVVPEGFVVLMGTKSAASGLYDPLLVRWGDLDSAVAWSPTATNSAGELLLRDGGRIVAGLPARRQSLLWTETTLEALQFTADSSVFVPTRVSAQAGLIAQNAAIMGPRGAVWMTPDFRVLRFAGGAVEDLECPLAKRVEAFLNFDQKDKMFAMTVGRFGEVWFVYPDTRDGTGECSRYISVNPTGEWSCGMLDRTCWLDAGVLPGPVGWSANGASWYHEEGHTANGAPLASWVESSALDEADGEQAYDIDGVLPDIADQLGVVRLTLIMRDRPRAPERSTVIDIAAGTDRVPFQARGRQMRLRVDGIGAPSRWRLGEPRFEVYPRQEVW